jgi:hypothetical protein
MKGDLDMENNNADRYLHFLFETINPVYLKEKALLNVVRKYPSFEINGDNQTDFIDLLTNFVNENRNTKRMFIIINADDINISNQRILSYMVKDKAYQTLSLPRNTKIIVVGNKNNINKELFALLGIVDV